MPTLNWIGKEAVTNHDKEVPFKLLKKVKTASAGDNSQNLIIHGDNLEALKALMPYYIGRIKCIYIDPPYNTGNESWVYNDKVNSPKIKQWLDKTVKIDDLTRHDKWLCMMYPRLKLLHDLLSDDGVIFISIDDNEVNVLKLVMDEIFGAKNFVSMLVVQINPRGRTFDRFVAKTHEYILTYAKDISIDSSMNLVQKEGATLNSYKKSDDRGVYRELELRNRNPVFGRHNRPNLFYPLYVDDKTLTVSIKKDERHVVEVFPRNSEGKDGCWTWGRDKTQKEINKLVARKASTGAWRIFRKDYLFDEDGGEAMTKAKALWLDSRFNNENGKEEVRDLFKETPFDFPKSVELIKQCVRLGSNPGDIILDSFAGSGTTGHAVLDLNKEDNGNRKFIMVEMEDKVAKDITAERIRRAIKKYDFKEGFEYCELDKPLFDERGQIEDTCDFRQFATYIYFTETQTNIDPKKIDENYIGELGTTEYYLLYKGKNKNDLNKSFLKRIKKTDSKKVIYADRCLIDDETLAKYNVVFKQIPYEVKVY